MEKDFGKLYNEIITQFQKTQSVNKTVEATGASKVTVQKALITEGLWESRRSQDIIRLKNQGFSTEEIAEALHISIKGVQAYLPYSRTPYGSVNTKDSLRSKKKREQMQIALKRQVTVSETNNNRNKKPGDDVMNILRSFKSTEKKIGNQEKNRMPMAFKLHLELVQDESGTGIRFSPDEEEIIKQYARYHEGISRDIIAPSDMTLHALHYAIQKLFGWGNSHLREFSLLPDDFQTVTSGLTSVWEELCGVYFRFPVEDDEESYWDDDYDGKKSFNSWLKQKYTGPYFVYCSRDSYVENQLLVDQFNTEFRQSTKTKPAKNLNEFVQQIWLGGNTNCLMERIRLSELFVPDNMELPSNEEWWSFTQNSLQHVKDSEPELLPFVHSIIYQYDFGDGWCIKITCKEGYYTDVEITSTDSQKDDITNSPELSTKHIIFESKDSHNVCESLNEIITVATSEKKPICIEADGMNLVDDVGGIYGFVDFVKTLYGGDAEEANEMKIWAESLGWSSRMKRPEKML